MLAVLRGEGLQCLVLPLDTYSLSLSGYAHVWQELGEHNGSFSHLEDILKQVGDCRAQAQNGLAHAEELMKNEAKEVGGRTILGDHPFFEQNII